VDKVEIKDSQIHVTAVTILLECYTLLIRKQFRTFRKIILLLPSGSSRPRGVTKLLRDDTLLSLLSKDKRGLMLRKCEVGICTRGDRCSDTDSAISPTP
jgi:hypothetical protein